ncbi:YnbE family lipoprotein [uncultured Parasphingopyxis sp.]|uniref:YnbE family lipoprotein n=1 Tax=uncultured Parasphingopyxis sp. TaxID=1547918 RepID=UPI00345B6D9F
MTIPRLTMKESNATTSGMTRIFALSLMVGAIALAGCVQVNTPEDPIVIELNINVQQTIDVNLQEDVQNLIEDNPDLFPE